MVAVRTESSHLRKSMLRVPFIKIIQTTIGIARYNLLPDPGAEPETAGTARYDLMTEVL